METLIRRAVKKAQMEVPREAKAHMGRQGRKLWAEMHKRAVESQDLAFAIRLKHLVIKDEIRKIRKAFF